LKIRLQAKTGLSLAAFENWKWISAGLGRSVEDISTAPTVGLYIIMHVSRINMAWQKCSKLLCQQKQVKWQELQSTGEMDGQSFDNEKTSSYNTIQET
jgi:hypothetical protein